MDSVSIDALMSLGFTQTEAKVYCAMVPEESANGYQIAKTLNLSRSSVYAALENLLEKGAIHSIPGKVNDYTVVEPELLLDKIISNYKKSAEVAKESLNNLAVRGNSRNFFLNIQGLKNIIDNIQIMIHKAEREILISTSMDLNPIKDDLNDAVKRGVRVVVFSMLNLNLYGVDIEFYGGRQGIEKSSEQRFSIVTDNSACLVCSNDKQEFISFKQFINENGGNLLSTEDKDFLGMKSTNRLMVNIIQEHFHFDVYLHKLLIKNNGEQIITDDIQLGTLMERGN